MRETRRSSQLITLRIVLYQLIRFRKVTVAVHCNSIFQVVVYTKGIQFEEEGILFIIFRILLTMHQY